MARPVTLCTLQWGDLPLDVICEKAKSFGFDGVELGLPSHLDVRQTDPEYYRNIKVTLDKYGLQLFCISNHLVGQAICDNIDQRHKSVLPDYIWGDGDPDGVHLRAVENMIQAAHAARMLGVDTVVGFTGSSIWQWLYSFPPVTDEMVNEGYADFARRFIPILDEYQKLGVRFALEVHPTEIAFEPFGVSGSGLCRLHQPVPGSYFPCPHERCVLERYSETDRRVWRPFNFWRCPPLLEFP